MKKINLEYNCVFCRQAGGVEYDMDNPLSEEQVAKWLSKVACDPCAKYQRARSDAQYSLRTLLGRWEQTKDTSDDIPEVRERLRRRLARILTKLATAAANFRHRASKFDGDCVETLIDHPERKGIILTTLTCE